MKWKYYPLSDEDAKAQRQIVDSLSVGAFERRAALSTKLLERFSTATGPAFAIAMELLDLDHLADYAYATYDQGKRWYEVAGANVVPYGDAPNDGLVQFLVNYLRLHDDAVVIFDNWWTNRHELRDGRYKPHLATAADPFVPRFIFHDQDVYQLLKHSDMDTDFIDETIREAQSLHWMNAVCCRTNVIVGTEIPSDCALDEIVAATDHIVVSAFDNEGYLVWSPRR
jgi:hypothetical protein